MIIERMARDLGLPTGFIVNLAHGASYEYKIYSIPKRSGGHRVIHHPSRRLKALQRWLLSTVIQGLPIHPAATAYRKHRSIFQNAAVHAKSRFLLRMDLTNFFPSLTQSDLVNYVAEHVALFSDWTPLDIDVFCRLVCRNLTLTIGAPTSPALSNALCYEMDVLMHALCAKSGVAYSRYADDLFFSCDQPNVLRQIEKDVAQVVSQLKIPANIRLNPAKTRHSSKRRERRVTGIVLGSDGCIYVGRVLKRKIRALIHTVDSLDASQRASLSGLIAYVAGYDPQFMNSLIDKYGLQLVRKVTSLTAR
jgi:RNA-directed DNA polymerase